MTSKEIKELKATDLSEREWLKELAYQLARMNERETPYEEIAPAPQIAIVAPRKRGRPRKVA